MRFRIIAVLLYLNFMFLLGSCESVGVEDKTEPEVENLLKSMTLDEKLGQMTQICFSNITLDGTKTLDLNADLFREAILNHKVGSFLSGTGPKEKWINFITEMQRIAVEESRLGIPPLMFVSWLQDILPEHEATRKRRQSELAAVESPEFEPTNLR